MRVREVEELLLERGIDVSYETVRRWVAKLGPAIARGLRCRQPHSGRPLATARTCGGTAKLFAGRDVSMPTL